MTELWKPFSDRRAAGRILARSLDGYAGQQDVVVLALPRGGVPVAFEVARALGAPLDIFMVRKLGVPGREELTMGAVASGGIRVLNGDVVRYFRVPSIVLDEVTEIARRELERRERIYRDDRTAPALNRRTVILVDDGLTTGSTMRAAIAAVRAHHPARVVVAVPVAADEFCEEFRLKADDTIFALLPEPFHSVDTWYEDFGEVGDEAVRALLANAQVFPSSQPTGRFR